MASENVDQAAVLSKSSVDVRAEIAEAVSKALNGRKVLISQNSLMDTNRLIIERRSAMHQGISVMTRDMPMPDHFRLMMTGTSCVLVHEQTGETYPLSRVACKPLKTDG